METNEKIEIYEKISFGKILATFFLLTIIMRIVNTIIFKDSLYSSLINTTIIYSFLLLYLISKIDFHGIRFRYFIKTNIKKIESKKLFYIASLIAVSSILSIVFLYYNFFHHELKLFYPEFFRNILLNLIEEQSELLLIKNNLYILIEIIIAVIIGPILEEIIFRGVLLAKLRKVFSEKRAIIIVSTFFAILHANLFGAFIFSILTCYIMIKYNNLFLCIIMHSVHNFFTSFFVYYYDYFYYLNQGLRLNYNLIFVSVVAVLFLLIFFRTLKSYKKIKKIG